MEARRGRIAAVAAWLLVFVLHTQPAPAQMTAARSLRIKEAGTTAATDAGAHASVAAPNPERCAGGAPPELLLEGYGSSGSKSAARPMAATTPASLLSPRAAFGVATQQRLCAQQGRAFADFHARLLAEKPVSVLALGGSMAAGVDCSDIGDGNASASFSGKACSYSARFARRLEATYFSGEGGGAGGRTSGVAYRNMAMGGTTTAGVLPQLSLLVTGGAPEDRLAAVNGASDGGSSSSSSSSSGDESPSLVFVDFSVNDRFEEQDWMVSASARNGGGDKVASQSASSAATANATGGGSTPGAGFSAGDKVFAATEALLRHLLVTYPATAVVLVEGFCDNRDSFSRSAHKRAALVYGVPFVAYGRLLRDGCSAVACGGGKGGRGCQTTPHPPASVHEALAQGLASWWGALNWRLDCRDAVPGAGPASARAGEAPVTAKGGASLPFMLGKNLPPLAPPPLAERYKVCATARSSFSAADFIVGRPPTSPPAAAALRRPVVGRGSWLATFEGSSSPSAASVARRDKAAWVTSEDGSELSFPLSFGASPRVALVFAKGYDATFGDALVTMEGAPPGKSRAATLAGCCSSQRVTQGELVVLNVGQDAVFSAKASQEGGGMGFAVPPFTNRTLTLHFVKGAAKKFALSFVSSC